MRSQRLRRLLARRAEFVEPCVATLVGQRIFIIALGYEDLSSYDDPRHEPIMATLAARRSESHATFSAVYPRPIL